MDYSRLRKTYEGKAKILYDAGDGDLILQRFKDSATAFNGVKYAEFGGKGELNNRISTTLFRYLADQGIPSHWVETLNRRDMLIRRVTIIPLEVVVRNVVAGSLAKRLGLDEGTPLPRPIVELYYKRDDLGDPMINDDHALSLGLATQTELARCREIALLVNGAIQKLWAQCGLELIDFKLEFGRTADGAVLLADEISPDTSRLWDRAANRRMDKDVFRRDLADLVETYTEVYNRLRAAVPEWVPGELGDAPEING